jgi:hypothetical protein
MSQIQNYYFGVDFGINKEFINVQSNDMNYFDCQRKCWTDSEGFYKRNGYFNLRIGIISKNKLNFELGFSRLMLNRTAQHFPPDLITSGGSSLGYLGISPEIKWTLSVGKKYNLGQNVFYYPLGQIAYMLIKNNTDTIYNNVEIFRLYTYREFEQSLNQNHFFIGLKNKFEVQLSKRLKMNASLAYNQGLTKNYYIKQEIQLNQEPKTTFFGSKSSRLSHAFISIGLDYYLASKI